MSSYVTATANERGQVLLGSLAIIILLFTLSAFAALAISAESQSLRECRAFVLKHQRNIAIKLTQLQRLNPKARRLTQLRMKSQAALTAALASGHPIAIAKAKAKDQKVHLLQLVLRADQQTRLAQMRFSNQYVRLRARLIPSVRIGEVTYRAQGIPQLTLKPIPATSLTPEWIESLTFTNDQELKVTYHFQSPIAPESLSQLFQVVSGTCAASIVRARDAQFQAMSGQNSSSGAERWEPRLTKDNLFSRSFGFF